MDISKNKNKLPKEILSRRNNLPIKPDPHILKGKNIYLRPLDIIRDADALYQISNGTAITIGNKHCGPYDSNQKIWKHLPYGPFNNIDDFKENLLAIQSIENQLVYVIFDSKANHPIGIGHLSSNYPENLKIELGYE